MSAALLLLGGGAEGSHVDINYVENDAPFVDMSNNAPFNSIEDGITLAHAIVDTVRDPLLVLDQDLRIVAASRRGLFDKLGLFLHRYIGIPSMKIVDHVAIWAMPSTSNSNEVGGATGRKNREFSFAFIPRNQNSKLLLSLWPPSGGRAQWRLIK